MEQIFPKDDLGIFTYRFDDNVENTREVARVFGTLYKDFEVTPIANNSHYNVTNIPSLEFAAENNGLDYYCQTYRIAYIKYNYSGGNLNSCDVDY